MKEELIKKRRHPTRPKIYQPLNYLSKNAVEYLLISSLYCALPAWRGKDLYQRR